MPPRSSLRNRTATPARAARATTAATQDTSATRRSTRAASRQPLATRDAASNPALPEIQVQQSYAYGSSKTPALPEQLHVSQISSMRAVANRLADANAEAEQNFEAHAAELKADTPESQVAAREARAQRRASKEPVQRSPPAATPDAQRKQNRVAAWVDSSQLEDVPEEDSDEDIQEDAIPTDLDREESAPSSFPDGSFNHSYNYERGIRGPNLPLPSSEPEPDVAPNRNNRTIEPVPEGSPATASQSRIQPFLMRLRTQAIQAIGSVSQSIQSILLAAWSWLSRMIQMMRKSVLELPDAPVTSSLFKIFLLSAILGTAGLSFCTLFTYTCSPGSTSSVSQTLQRVCGQCAGSDLPQIVGWNITMADPNDLNSLLQALKQTQVHISQVESRLSSRIDSSHASHLAGVATLRSHQETLEKQILRLRSHTSLKEHSSSQGISSPLIADKINFFSPAAGVSILPELTSPTRAEGSKGLKSSWSLGRRILGLHQPLQMPPANALESWTDEGDCWCAAANHSLRLAVQLKQQIFPTEIVIEHFPGAGSLQPGNAPKDFELWADFGGISAKAWQELHVNDLRSEFSTPPLGVSKKGMRQTWACIGTATYAISATGGRSSMGAREMSADDTYGLHSTLDHDTEGDGLNVPHLQRFNLHVNQHGLLHYASRFLLSVTSNHGADYTCLYRVRLHGVPVNRT